MPPFSIQHIDHIVLRVADLQRSIDFYRQVFGAEVVRYNEPLGLVHLRAGTSLIEHLQSCGLSVEKAARRFGAEGYGLSLYCFDPDGNQVELKGPSEA